MNNKVGTDSSLNKILGLHLVRTLTSTEEGTGKVRYRQTPWNLTVTNTIHGLDQQQEIKLSIMAVFVKY
jgi:hypothetical protein